MFVCLRSLAFVCGFVALCGCLYWFVEDGVRCFDVCVFLWVLTSRCMCCSLIRCLSLHMLVFARSFQFSQVAGQMENSIHDGSMIGSCRSTRASQRLGLQGRLDGKD